MKILIFTLAFFFTLSLLAQNVGVKTTDPQTVLHVADDDRFTGGLTIGTGTANDGGNLRLLNNSNHWNLDNYSSDLRFFTESGFGTGFSERFRMNGDGSAGFNINGLSLTTGLTLRNPSNNELIFSVRSSNGTTNRFLVLQSTEDNFTYVGFNRAQFNVRLNVSNLSANINTIFNVESSNGADRFTIREDGRAGFNGVLTGVGLNVHNPSADIDYIFNVEFGFTDHFTIREDGRAGFNGVLPGVGLNVHNRSSSSSKIFNVENSDGLDRFYVTDNDNVHAPKLPFGDHKSMQYRTSDGRFFYDNSSRRYKRNIQPLEDDFHLILKAQPKTYTRPDDPDRWELGYIAEEMDSLGLCKLVSYDEEGIPDGFNYEKMILYVNEILKSHQADLEAKEQEIASLNQSKEQLQTQFQQQQQAIKALQTAVFTGSTNNSSTDLSKKK